MIEFLNCGTNSAVANSLLLYVQKHLIL